MTQSRPKTMLGLLKEARKEILFLMGLASGLWYLLEPPIEGQSGALSGYVAVTIFGMVLGLRSTLVLFDQNRVIRLCLLVLGIFSAFAAVVAFGNYFVTRSQLVMQYQTGPQQTVEVIRGDTYEPIVQEILQQGRMTDSEILDAVGGLDGRYMVWTRASIWQAERELTWKYLLMALSSLFSVACFVETLRHTLNSRKGAKPGASKAISVSGSNGD